MRSDQPPVADYEALLKENPGSWPFPQLVVYRLSGVLFVVEGFAQGEAAHRCRIEKLPCDIRDGGEEDAFLTAVGSNASHGFRRTNKDKRRAVERACFRWKDLSQREIAKRLDAKSDHCQ